jgi:hypothetical protein
MLRFSGKAYHSTTCNNVPDNIWQSLTLCSESIRLLKYAPCLVLEPVE